MLSEILRRQAYKDNSDVALYPTLDKVNLIPDIPVLDTHIGQHVVWDYAMDPITRLRFRYWGFDKPKDDDDDLD